jgi:hypothetical protein
MSAWGVGRQGGTEGLAGGPNDIKAFVDRVVQWIPADVVAIYTVGITTLRTQNPDPNPSLLWLGIAGVLSFALVLLAAQRTRKQVVKRDLLLALMAVVAFAIWSLAIPDSGWYRWSVVVDNPGWVALIAGLGGLLFGVVVSAFFEG